MLLLPIIVMHSIPYFCGSPNGCGIFATIGVPRATCKNRKAAPLIIA